MKEAKLYREAKRALMLRQLPFLRLKDAVIYPDSTMEDLGSTLADATLESVKEYSSHPDDGHLRVILARWKGVEPWVTWLVNTNDPAAFQGHYFETHKAALTDYHNRGRS